MDLIGLIVFVIELAAMWKIFQKMGRQGWEGIIPFYSTYILFQELYGNGWKMLFLLIPFYNIYLAIRLYIDLARAFNMPAAFGVGLILLSTIFMCILAFGSAVYGDGSKEVTEDDPISAALNKVSAAANAAAEAIKQPKEAPEAEEAPAEEAPKTEDAP